jgi:hypothetical protein
MDSQNYSNHTQTVPAFHRIFVPVILLTWVGSGVNLYQSWGDHQRLYSASLLLVLTTAVIMLGFLARIFALKAQDRAIRAEENLRHFVLTGKLLDPRLNIKQITGLRFASDAEFPDLARRAADENLTTDGIKRAVQNWRADRYRV